MLIPHPAASASHRPSTPAESERAASARRIEARTAGRMPGSTGFYGQAQSDFGFFDLVDIVNPLQHLPIVNILYREVTDDTIKPFARIAGGGLFGGVAGAVSGVVNVAVEEATGLDLAGNVVALIDGEKDESEGESPEERLTQIAQLYQDLPGSTIGVASLSIPARESQG